MTEKTQLDRIETWQEIHGHEDNRRFSEVTSDIGEIKSDVRVIKENHLAHIQDSTTELATDMKWVKKLMWGQLSGLGVLGIGLLTAFLSKLL